MTKRNNSGIAKWKRCTGQGMGKGGGAFIPSLGTLFSPNLMFTSSEVLQTHPFEFLQRLHYTDMIDRIMLAVGN